MPVSLGNLKVHIFTNNFNFHIKSLNFHTKSLNFHEKSHNFYVKTLNFHGFLKHLLSRNTLKSRLFTKMCTF